jgi:hypothetical protein
MAKEKKQKQPSAKAQAAAAHAKAQQEQAAGAFDVSLADLLRLNEVGPWLPALALALRDRHIRNPCAVAGLARWMHGYW